MSTVARIQQIVAEVLQVPVERVQPHVPLYQVTALDSMHLVEIATALDDEFQTRLPKDGLEEAHSVEDLVRLVESAPRR